LIFWVATIFLLPVSYGRPPLALAGLLVNKVTHLATFVTGPSCSRRASFTGYLALSTIARGHSQSLSAAEVQQVGLLLEKVAAELVLAEVARTVQLHSWVVVHTVPSTDVLVTLQMVQLVVAVGMSMVWIASVGSTAQCTELWLESAPV